MSDAETPVISVVMPTFNRLKYIPAAVASVFAQTFTDWELIVADDGSDEETKAYLRTLHQPPRVRVIWLSHCGCPGAVRNAAVREARGEYIAFLDSDDIWLPQKLSAQVASLASRPSCGWSFTSFSAVDAAGNPLPGSRGRHWPVTRGWILQRLITMNSVVALPSVMVRRDLIADAGGFDTGLRMCEDYDLWLRLAARSEADAVSEMLVHLRRHGEHCGSDAIAFEERARVLEKVLGRTTDRSLQLLVRRERAKVAVGLARSHAVYGSSRTGLRALLRSPSDAWRYREWWLGTGEVMVRAFTPDIVRRFARRVWRFCAIDTSGQNRETAGARDESADSVRAPASATAAPGSAPPPAGRHE